MSGDEINKISKNIKHGSNFMAEVSKGSTQNYTISQMKCGHKMYNIKLRKVHILTDEYYVLSKVILI